MVKYKGLKNIMKFFCHARLQAGVVGHPRRRAKIDRKYSMDLDSK